MVDRKRISQNYFRKVPSFKISPDLLEHTQQILGVRLDDLLCLLCDHNPAEQMPALIPFIQNTFFQLKKMIRVEQEFRRALAEQVDVDFEHSYFEERHRFEKIVGSQFALLDRWTAL